jgi:hypothetical protein
MRCASSYIFLCLFVGSFFASIVQASTCREKLQAEEIQELTGLSPEQIAIIRQGSGSFSSLEVVMAKGIPQDSILLGPTGRVYKALIKRYQMMDFWGAFYEVSMNSLREQTPDYVKLFFEKLHKQTRHPVYFLIPEKYETTRMTKTEIEILFENPELMANIHFIYTPQTNFKILEVNSIEPQSRPRHFIQRLKYYFRFLIY